MSLDNATPAQWDAAWRAARKTNTNTTLTFNKPSAAQWDALQKATDEQYPVGAPEKPAANPKQLYGDKKVPLHLVPGSASAYIAIGLKEGSRKYGAFNWRETSVEAMTYIGATYRHLAAFVDGEDTDPESGNPHLAHAMASLAILIDALESGKVIDNRPIAGPAADTLTSFKSD